MIRYRYYYNQSGEIEILTKFIGNCAFINDLPYIETDQEYDLRSYQVDITTQTIVLKNIGK